MCEFAIGLLWVTALLQPYGCPVHAQFSSKYGHSGWTLRAGIGHPSKANLQQSCGRNHPDIFAIDYYS